MKMMIKKLLTEYIFITIVAVLGLIDLVGMIVR